MRRLAILAAMAAAVLGLAMMSGSTASGSGPVLLDSVNIGDTTSETTHDLQDWSKIWLNCSWCGPDKNMRLIWGAGGETCDEEDNWASVQLDAGSLVAMQLSLEHLDGSADDGFNVYVNGDPVGTYEDFYTSNTWVETPFDISAGGPGGLYTGLLTIKLEATAPAWGGCATYGQVAFNMIKLYGGPLPVEIDIKPGSYPNSINPNGHGVIPVAILTTDTFDATTVDPGTVTLEGSVVRVKGKSGNAGSLDDVDGDGDLDLVVQIVDDSMLAGKGTAVLRGQTFDGTDIEGSDTIYIVPPES